ncbi:glycosyltransferase [Algoriphagus hitonicola]|uniref:Glycosyltransferase involved in cell wall bisynthesis n=1 Tax=Algoriphagus hitonicola TaxID=435880 RepID=A0A1I2TLD1_9BACT|nr:glycosyltransferase [Algoriphagus hitonicola]SFG64167.1 Glycosyltransferase involved in cell wall bisynthesis [Algoriphagus hitonicola]
MKVLRIVSELDFGGVEQVGLNSLPALQQAVKLKVLVLKNGGRVSDLLIHQGVSIKILGKNPRIPNFKLIRLVRKEIREFQPDVVHSQGAEANFHGVLAASFEHVPRIIAEEIGIPNHHSYWKWVFSWVYGKAHQVIAISEAVKEEIVRLGEVLPEKVKVIYNPIKSVQGLRLGVQGFTGSDFVFVTTCRLVPIKNLERLIQAFEELVMENSGLELFLKIVGDGPERENLEKRIREKRLENRVEILGFQENVWPFLADSDAFILPSLQEGSSVSLAEAMAAGLPSIVTQVGGATEILGNSQSGLLIDPLDTNSIQSVMQQIIDLSPEERQAMGERAKKEAQRFSVDNYIKELMNIYHSPIP